jgi:phenylpropionate dioxygenase-like ring-hydroxylating dioxygenase large terminal subunit
LAFLKNAWYVAAWSHEVTDQLFHRTIMNSPVCIYRKQNGDPVAIADSCPHRFAPLHMGRIKGDFVECGYHGLQFDGHGDCVFNPHGDRKIPQMAKVRSYPLVERYSILWLWAGAPELADQSTIPDYSYLVDKDRKTVYGGKRVLANYELIADNLMDASHTQYVHLDLLGTEAFTRSQHEVIQEGDMVHSNYLLPGGEVPQIYKPYFDDPNQLVDFRVFFRWQPPALVRNSVSLTPAGRPIEEGLQRTGTHLMTPETDTTSHYFFCHTRNFKLDDAEIDDRIRVWHKSGLSEQDCPIIEAVQASMGDTTDLNSLRPVLLPMDAAAVRVRRVLAKMIRDEQQTGGLKQQKIEPQGDRATV